MCGDERSADLGSRVPPRRCARAEDVEIVPCVRVAFTDALGNPREAMITSRMMRQEPSKTKGWTVYTLEAGLPPGGTIEAVEIGLHSHASPQEPVSVRFDDVVVNDEVFTHPDDHGVRR